VSWLSEFARAGGLPGFFGGVLGASITLFLQGFLPWWRQPRLIIERGLPGVIVDTPARTGTGATARERYARIRVRNQGRSVAKNVRCMIERIVFFPAGAGAQMNDEEVLDLLWVFVHGTTCDIPRSSHRFAELCHVSQREGGPVVLTLGARDVPLRFATLLDAAGMFEFHVLATAETPARSRRLSVFGGPAPSKG
jgi:hypothetical protein